MNLRKKVTTVFGAAAAASVIAGAAAFACTNLATLNLSSTAGKGGDVITVTGSSFQVGRGDTPTLPVKFHWNSVDGPVLAEVIEKRSLDRLGPRQVPGVAAGAPAARWPSVP